MNQSIIIRFALATLLVACGKKEKTIQPEYRELTEAVYASGNIYPENEYRVFANADGILQEIFAEEGDSIRAGQVLFRIDNEAQQIRTDGSNAIYSKAAENYSENSPALRELESSLASLKNKLSNDSVNYIRFKNLADKNATSQSELDRAKLAYTTSKNDYEARKNNLKKIRNQLYVELENAQVQMRSNKLDRDNYLVKSYINGLVYEVLKKRGESIRRGEPIALVGDAGKVYAKLVVDELDIARLKNGQEVLIKLDYNKNKVYTAKVVKIYPKLNREDQSFRVDAAFTGEQPPILYGLTIEANIVISNKPKTLTIPKAALMGGDSVLVKTEEGEKRIKIQTGLENLEYTEVLSGLTEKSEIVLKK